MTFSSRRIVIATGTRPVLPTEEEVPNCRKLAISSDDLFWMKTDPKNTLIIGGGYVALECASFLNGIGRSVTVMIRSDVALRYFDQECVKLLISKMKENGVRFIFNSSVKRLDEEEQGTENNDSKQIRVTYQQQQNNNESTTEVFNTVLFAIGRKADEVHAKVLQEKVGVEIDPKRNKILIDKWNRTSVPNIYAVGAISQVRDVPENSPARRAMELAPVAAKSGILLANRLYRPGVVSKNGAKQDKPCTPCHASSTQLNSAAEEMLQDGMEGCPNKMKIINKSSGCGNNNNNNNGENGAQTSKKCYFQKTLDPNLIPTVISTSPFEFASIGISESNMTLEEMNLFKVERIYFNPESGTMITSANLSQQQHDDKNDDDNQQQQHDHQGFLKLILDPSQSSEKGGKVLGAHLLAPNASEILQGLAIALKCGATREDFVESLSPY